MNWKIVLGAGIAGVAALSVFCGMAYMIHSRDNTIAELRDALPPFGEATPLIAAIGDDILSITAHDAQDSACVLVNASLENAHDTAVPMMGETVSETIAGYGVAVVEADEIDEVADAVGAAHPRRIRIPDKHLSGKGRECKVFQKFQFIQYFP